MNEFTIRVIAPDGENNKGIAEKKEKLVELLAADGWFKVVEGSGEESAGLLDIVVIGKDEEKGEFASVGDKKIWEKDLDVLAWRLHQIFFARWVQSHKKRRKRR